MQRLSGSATFMAWEKFLSFAKAHHYGCAELTNRKREQKQGAATEGVHNYGSDTNSYSWVERYAILS